MNVNANQEKIGAPPLWEKLPEWVRDQDDGTTKRILDACADVAQDWQKRVRQTGRLYDHSQTPEWAANLLLRSWAMEPPAALKLEHKRRLICWAAPLWQRAGTAPGIEQAVRAITGTQARCLPWNHGWTLDTDHQLDHDADLAASLRRPQEAHAFDLEVQGRPGPEQEAAIRALTDMIRPAHCPLRRLIHRQTPARQTVRRFAARCALGLFRQPDRDQHINAALATAAKTLDLPGIAPPRQEKAGNQATDHPEKPAPRPALPEGARLDPGRGLVVDQDKRPLSVERQAAALKAWTLGKTPNVAAALAAGLAKQPFHGATALFITNNQACCISDLADLVIALCNFLCRDRA